MIIDCHGHYTTAPGSLQVFRDEQIARLAGSNGRQPTLGHVSDDAIRESIESNQLKLLRQRGGDMMLFSPKASAMEHHVTDPPTARAWARACNDLIYRVVGLFPQHFSGVCQLPQTPGGQLDDSIEELRHSVEDLGFVGCNLNPDPSGGYWTSKPLTDRYWYPLYEQMVALDVPRP